MSTITASLTKAVPEISMFIASFNALVSIDATLLPVSNILYDIAFVAPPIAFASALFAFVFASTVPAKFITAMSELIPASIKKKYNIIN